MKRSGFTMRDRKDPERMWMFPHPLGYYEILDSVSLAYAASQT
jgi:hypothetical protein